MYIPLNLIIRTYRHLQHRHPKLTEEDSECGTFYIVAYTEDDSGGCIIVGENSVKGKVINSRATFKKLYALLEKEKDITIEIY